MRSEWWCVCVRTGLYTDRRWTDITHRDGCQLTKRERERAHWFDTNIPEYQLAGETGTINSLNERARWDER